MKHERQIRLEPWQQQIALDRYPELFLRGLIQSDGCRAINGIKRIKGPGPMRLYCYPRYQFKNRSDDIRGIFKEACNRLGIECRQSNAWTLSVSKGADVRYMDEFIGPKR